MQVHFILYTASSPCLAFRQILKDIAEAQCLVFFMPVMRKVILDIAKVVRSTVVEERQAQLRELAISEVVLLGACGGRC